MDAVVVRVQDVSKSFDGTLAVDDVSLNVGKGEFVSLLGPSGCGKTTLLRIIGGFEAADRGAVFLEGTDYTDVAAHRRPVNMVFQSYALFPHLTIFENVAFGLRRKKTPEPAVKRLVHQFLELVGLAEFGARYPRQLSGGQQQRVALARALVNQPSVLLLDEPLAALDLKLRKRMQVELKVLQRELGISFIYVTHDQEEALALSDRIAVMNNGRVLQYGPAREVYDHPRSEFVARFLGEANIVRCDVHSSGDRLVLTLDDRLIYATASVKPPVTNTSVALAIRPEDIVVSTSELHMDNVLPCVIENKIFSGAAPVVFVNVGDGRTLSVRSADRATFDQLQPGMPAFIGWQAMQGAIVSGEDNDEL